MNLTGDPWIPIVWADGRAGRVSLREAFVRGREIRDLAVRPHERIALMRLLICVAQAALDGPRDRADWRTAQDRLPGAVAAYLDRWRGAFELFGDGPRFLQARDLTPVRMGPDSEGGSVSKLDLALATGNNSTLFDNAGGSERSFAPADLALMLLTYQCFSPGGLIGDVKWRGRAMGRSSNHAPCVIRALLHTFVRGDSLLATIHANTLPRAGLEIRGMPWGAPIWERMPGVAGDADCANATGTYLGRLLPLCRLVRLGEDGGLTLGNGLEYEGFPGWRETAATVVRRERDGKEERLTLAGSVSKAVWREAHAIAVLQRAGTDPLGGPLALANVPTGEPCDVWAGALVADKAKLVDTVEATLHLPAAMLGDAGQQHYQDGVRYSERRATALGRAVSAYRKALSDELDRPESRKRGLLVKQNAATHYWTAVEQCVGDLLGLVEDPGPLYPDGTTRPAWASTDWGRAVAAASRAAYDLACPHGTPRQLRAYSLGLAPLFRQPATDDATAAADPDSTED